MPIVSYDSDQHEAFVVSAIAAGAGRGRAVLRALVMAGVNIAVYVGQRNPSLCIGFAIVAGPQRVVWCYTKQKLRGKGIMRLLLEHLGVDVTRPMRAHWWSPACDALMAEHGWPITYLPEALHGRGESAPGGAHGDAVQAGAER